MALNNFIFYKDIADQLLKVEDPLERNDFAWRIIKYGAFNEKDWTDDEFKNGWLKNIFASIDKAKKNYESKVQIVGNRKKFIDENKFKELISQRLTAREIGEELGVSASTVNHHNIWIDRKKYNYYDK